MATSSTWTAQVNPVRDKEIIDTELQLKDLDTVETASSV